MLHDPSSNPLTKMQKNDSNSSFDWVYGAWAQYEGLDHKIFVPHILQSYSVNEASSETSLTKFLEFSLPQISEEIFTYPEWNSGTMKNDYLKFKENLDLLSKHLSNSLLKSIFSKITNMSF